MQQQRPRTEGVAVDVLLHGLHVDGRVLKLDVLRGQQQTHGLGTAADGEVLDRHLQQHAGSPTSDVKDVCELSCRRLYHTTQPTHPKEFSYQP